MGLATAGPKLFWVLLGARPNSDQQDQLNIFSLGAVAQPDPISIYLKTKLKK